MTYYTAAQPVLLLRALHITTKAISRIGGWGRYVEDFFGKAANLLIFYVPTINASEQPSVLLWRSDWESNPVYPCG